MYYSHDVPEPMWRTLQNDMIFRTYVIPDTTPPDTTITSGPTGLLATKSAHIEFSSEEGATTECKLDDSDWVACSNSVDYNDLSDGEHVFRVRATDQAGNTDPTPAEITWTVDTKAPEGSVVLGGRARITDSRIVGLEVRASDPEPGSGVAAIRIKNAGGEWTRWKNVCCFESGGYQTNGWTLSKGEGKKVV